MAAMMGMDGGATPAASDDGAGRRSKTPRADTSTATAGSGGDSLTGIEETIQGAFHFLDGPADVLSAATACRRWRALACADSVWRAKFRREKLVEKARLFEVALPPVPVQGGKAGRGAAAAATAASAAALVKDEAAGVGLAFYARIFALKVAQVVVRSSSTTQLARRHRHACMHLTSASRTRRRRRRCAGVPDEGRELP